MQNQLYPVVSLQGSALWSPVTSPVEGWYDYGAGDDAGNDDHEDGDGELHGGDDGRDEDSHLHCALKYGWLGGKPRWAARLSYCSLAGLTWEVKY